LVKCGEPHKTADSFTSSAFLIGRISGVESFIILIVEAYSVIFYQETTNLGMGTIRFCKQIPSIPKNLDFNPAFLLVRILDCMDGVDDRLE
jgi:hypothetical protein